MNKAATFIGDKSGIKMKVLTEEPGVQFYSGNFMEGKNTVKSGAKDNYRTAFALETHISRMFLSAGIPFYYFRVR